MSAYYIPDIPLCVFVCSAYAHVSMLVYVYLYVKTIRALYSCTCFLTDYFAESRRSLIILMFLGELFFIVVAIAMVLEPRHLVIGSIYSYGAEGTSVSCTSWVFRSLDFIRELIDINYHMLFFCLWQLLCQKFLLLVMSLIPIKKGTFSLVLSEKVFGLILLYRPFLFSLFCLLSFS